MTLFIVDAFTPSTETAQLEQTSRKLKQALVHSDSLEKLIMRGQFENAAAKVQITELREQIAAVKPTIRRVYYVDRVDSTEIAPLKAALIARTNQLEDAVKERDLAISAADTLRAVATKAVNAFAEHLVADSVNLAETKKQADSVQAQVQAVEKAARRRWYHKTWSVAKKVSGKLIPFGLGYGAGRAS